MTQTYKDLLVWKKSVELVFNIYKLTENYPKGELFGLTNQMRRSSISIASNIAEGKSRFSNKEFRRFLLIAYGSGAELETQLEIGKKLNFGNIDEYMAIENSLTEIMKMLNTFSYKIAEKFY